MHDLNQPAYGLWPVVLFSFGQAYLDYKSIVPAFLPRLSTLIAQPAASAGTAS